MYIHVHVLRRSENRCSSSTIPSHKQISQGIEVPTRCSWKEIPSSRYLSRNYWIAASETRTRADENTLVSSPSPRSRSSQDLQGRHTSSPAPPPNQHPRSAPSPLAAFPSKIVHSLALLPIGFTNSFILGDRNQLAHATTHRREKARSRVAATAPHMPGTRPTCTELYQVDITSHH